MSAVSANPTLLAGFGPAVAAPRASAQVEQSSLVAFQGTVAAGCPGRAVSVPALSQVSTLLYNMHINERWLATIEQELVKADNTPGAVVTIDGSAVVQALQAQGLSTAPPLPVEFAATTREIQPPTSGMVDDPINAANGNMVHAELDVAFPAIAGALSVRRTWNSLRADVSGAFGPGWSSVLDIQLDVSPGSVVATMAEGNVIGFEPWENGWIAPGVPRLRLEETEHGWILHADHLRRFRFDTDGALTGWEVGAARVVVSRDRDGRIVTAHELVTGRAVSVRWNDEAVVDELATDDGRTVRYARADGVITSATSDAGSVEYRWSGRMLVSVIDADGVATFVNVYDADGRVIQQTSPFGRVSTYEYRADGMTVFTDAAGVVQAMHHDRMGNLTGVVDVDGSAMRQAYNQRRQLVMRIERDGATWRYRYDGDDLIEQIDPDGLSQRQAWDDRHRVIESIDRAGNVTRMEYDTEHVAPSRVIQPNGGVIHQHLDDRGLPTEIIDADGVTTRFRWDSDGQLVATVDDYGVATVFDYDNHGYLRGIAPGSGAPTVMDLLPGGRVRRTTVGDATWEYDYTPAGRVRGGVEPGDAAWSATFGEHGALASIADATGAMVAFDYDVNGNVTTTTAPDGAVYRHVYDEVGRLVAAIEPTGATTAKAYDRRGRFVEMTDPRGRTWHRELDVLGRTTSSTTPDGSVSTWRYDANGHPVEAIGPDGRSWRREFDADGRELAMIGPSGGRAVIEYTLAGRVSSRTSPGGRTERFEYDAAGRLSAVIGIDGIRRETRRDARGRVDAIVEIDADGNEHRTDYRWDDGYRLLGVTEPGDGGDRATTYQRDAGGRVTEAIDTSGVRRSFAWDQRGLLASATDPAGLVTSYEHDARGRLVGVVAPGERSTSLAYGLDGRTESITDPAGVLTRLHRDAAGVVTGQRHGDGSGWDRTLDAMDRELSRTSTSGVTSGEFSYDAAGRLVSATSPDSGIRIGFLWDDENLLEAITGPDGTRRIERDGDGWVTATIDPDGVRTDYRRDGRGRLIGVDAGGALARSAGGPSTHADSAAGPQWDLAGRLTVGRDGTVFRYDDAARIAEIAPLDATPTTFEYGRDGLLVVASGPGGRRELRYDEAGRVVAVVTPSGETSITYDRAGRRSREDEPDGTTTVYHWDDFGRLDRIERLDAAGLPAGEIAVGYDALDRPTIVDDGVTGELRVSYHPVSGLPLGEPATPGLDRPLGGVPVGDVFVVGARVLDPVTNQFLSPDPLLTVPATNGAASSYTYAWNDPINWVDPTGMRPVSIEDFEAYQSQNDQGTFEKAWEAIKEDPWGTLAMVGVTAVGVGLCFVPGGQLVGAGILIGVASGAGVGLATGTFNPRIVALSGAMGAIPGGNTLRGAVAIGAASGAGETVAASLLNGEGFPSPEQIVVGTVTGGGFGAGGHAVQNLLPNGSSATAPHLPDYDGSSTQGVLVTNEGATFPLSSGGPTPYPNYPAGSHVEGHAATTIRETGSTGGTVYHNNPSGTCNFCHNMVPTLLPEGTTLNVVPPANAVAPNQYWHDQPTSYVGNANEPKPPMPR